MFKSHVLEQGPMAHHQPMPVKQWGKQIGAEVDESYH
uniref:Uncharacterized protein n=1 Tax=Anguilla anguilla TaxID=7936 RepID=A0A0E9TRH3_ANGAN